MSDLSENLDDEQFAAQCHVTTRTTARWRKNGEGPRYVRVGQRRVIYRLADIEEWLSGRTYRSNAQELAAALKQAAPLPKVGPLA